VQKVVILPTFCTQFDHGGTFGVARASGRLMMAVVRTPEPARWGEDFVALYEERYGPMVRLAYLLTSDRGAAEELVQDAFVRVHASWGSVKDPASYLRTAVVNATRSWGRRRVLELHRRPAPLGPTPFVADDMWDALAVLPHRQRAAIVLRFYEDLPHAQIARLLDCREVTVRTSIHRGLARLRQEIER
jgi:RNA polymerase sigma-70 factor (sigma-E family)